MGLAGVRPAMPRLLQRLIAADRQGELFGKPDLCRHRLLQPLLKITRIESPDSLPVTGLVLFFLPSSLAGPVARCHEDEGAVCPLGGINRGEPRGVIPVRFDIRLLVGAELPIGSPLGNPGCGGARFDETIGALALRVVVAGEVDLAEVIAGRVHQLPQKDGKMGAGIDLAVGPVLYLPCLDSQEIRDEGANRDLLFFRAPHLPVVGGLHIEQPLPVSSERLFQPDRHFGGQGGFPV